VGLALGEDTMATILEQIHQSQPAFEKAINERLLWKRRHETAQYSRSHTGKEREAELVTEGREIWHRTEPVIQAHKSLMRAYLASQSTKPKPEQ
jgi:hypothetical protein